MYQHYGADMHGVTVVFPSRRASSFFFEELSRCSDTPVWAPTCITIDQLFNQLSPFEECDRLQTVCQLYRAYMAHVGPLLKDEDITLYERETLDRFWGWGEVLLSDIDDIDKHLADAHQIFKLIHDTEDLKSFDYLDEHQREALERFLMFTPEKGSKLQARFLRLWSKMSNIYDTLNAEQRERGQLYGGALQRDVVEHHLDAEHMSKLWPDICFVGFNVLNNVEVALLKAFQKYCRTRFYWDYDVFYLKNEQYEAGYFMRENLQNFPMPETVERSEFDNLSHLTHIDLVACSTDTSQARFVEQWREALNGKDAERELTYDAVVLCNERLVMPLMHAIPQQEDTTALPNITMGFPLTDTLVYGFIASLITLQTDGYNTVNKCFRLSYLQQVETNVYANIVGKELWGVYQGDTPQNLLAYLMRITHRIALHTSSVLTEEHPEREEMNMDVLYSESAMHIHRLLTRFAEMLDDEDIPMAINTQSLRNLLRQALSGVSIPFHGDQMKRLQVMGVLETRCLDFENLLMLSVEENYLPKKMNEVSFIMPLIRESFGLTTSRQQMAIFSYYFYRLIQRAKHVTCVYNDTKADIFPHEISRFLRQLQAETAIDIHESRLVLHPQVTVQPELTAVGADDVRSYLIEKYALDANTKKQRVLSPTAINAYLTCPLKFFFQYVANLRVEEEIEETIDFRILGNIFHGVAEAIYDDIIARQKGSTEIKAPTISTLLEANNPQLDFYIDVVFLAHYLQPIADEKQRDAWIKETIAGGKLSQAPLYQGRDIIARKVIRTYIENLLRYDLSRTPFHIVGLEQDSTFIVDVDSPQGKLSLRVGGRIDRLEEKDGVIRVVDYKTGIKKDELQTLDDVFTSTSKSRGYYLQAILYALSVKKSYPNKAYETSLFYPSQSFKEEYNPCLRFTKTKEDVCTSFDEFEQKLKSTLTEIFSAESFPQTADKSKACGSCDFAQLCGIRTK